MAEPVLTVPPRVSGFTLIEIAIVLVILALLGVVGANMLNARVEQNRIAETRQGEAMIKDALISFAQQNSRLPCPAVPTLPSTDANYGREAATPGTCTNAIAAGTAVRGVVPWRTLGLSDEIGADGYFQLYSYYVTLAATNLNANTIAGLQGTLNVYSRSPAIPANQLNIGNLAVAAIISHGKNGSGAYMSASGVRKALPAGANELGNTNDNANLIQAEYSEVAANPFDDMVLILTPNDILAPLQARGVIKPVGAAVGQSMDSIKASIIGFAVSNRDTTTPPTIYPLPANLGALGLPAEVTTDPWGTAIVYNRVAASITVGAAGTAYTLTSWGPNRADDAGGGDDIRTTVSALELTGIFAKSGF